MAGIERLEIHSKSYIVRWVKVDEGHTISWSVQPHKKSINFGIVKHPGSGATNYTSTSASATHTAADVDQLDGSTTANARSSRSAKKDASTAQDQLSSKGFLHMKWHGKCEADKVSMGTFDIAPAQGGMFGLVFDNTFSKQTSKTATFVLLTYPTGAPPQGAHHLTHQAATSKASLASPHLSAVADSTESLQSQAQSQSHPEKKGRAMSTANKSDLALPASYHTGNLLKRRRKKGQGHARRFFSLDYTTCTLSYYYNRKSSALRGAIPLSLAAIAADERRREISIDSGAEVWHLRASSAEEFKEWARALERASRVARGLEPVALPVSMGRQNLAPVPGPGPHSQHEEDQEWQQVEALVSRVVGTRDALRRLVKEMASQKYPTRPTSSQRPTSSYLSPTGTPGSTDDADGYFMAPPQEKRSFWKRKSSAPPLATASVASAASALAVPSPGSVATLGANGAAPPGRSQEERNTHDHCAALLTDLDSVVGEFTNLINNSKRRRIPALARASTARVSLESSASADEFFDAEAGESDNGNQVMMIDRRASADDSDGGSIAEEASIHDSSSVSSVEDNEQSASGAAALFPTKPKSLSPLPVDIAVERRSTIPAATCAPPNLIAIVRKYVGKDLSTVSMPISTNEPISFLQRVAEQLEYCQLLNKAAKQATPQERLLYVTAFAISQFSTNRSKERALRKPFNPLLGETFELLRTENEVPGGFRLIVEKVTHRPVRLAMHADSALWSFTQSPSPTQKFWGKSAELVTDGRVRVALRLPDGTDELYSWTVATLILKNMLVGEKYVEPAEAMTVNNDTTGARAHVEFKAKGMWGGRSEDVVVETFGPDGTSGQLGLSGTWTQSLSATGPNGGRQHQQHGEVWRAGSLVPDAGSTYGLTSFAATLNEETAVERGRLPPTDSRLRPDQRLAEQGSLDEAEDWKTRLEEAQRERRRALEERGEEHRPRWFVPVSGEEGLWRLRGGRDSYWEERARGEWKGCERIFDA